MDMDELGRWVERLERENQRLRAAGGVAVVVLLATSLLGAAKPQEVHGEVVARSFRVVDANGQMTALMTSRGLGYFDVNGTMRSQMTRHGFAYADGDDVLRLEMIAEHISFRDQSGAPRVVISAHGIRSLDPGGEITWQAPR